MRSHHLEVEAGRAEGLCWFQKHRLEKQMSKSIKFLAMVAFVGAVAACDNSPQEEFVVVAPEPISVEPTYTGKYK